MSGRHVWLETTARCNARCRYCYNVWRAPGADIRPPESSPDRLKEILEAALARLEPEALTLSGGEPLLRDDLEDLAMEAKRISPTLGIQVTTNGTLLNRKRSASLKRSGVSHVLVPLLSDRRETQAELMGLDTFDGACRAILSARAEGLLACAVFVATRRNLPEMEGAFRTALAMGSDEWMFLRFLPGGAGLGHLAELAPEPAALVDALERAERLGRRSGLSVTCGEPVPDSWLAGRTFSWVRFTRCAAGSGRLAVGPSGEVRPCEQDPRSLGNVLDPAFSLPSLAASACGECRWTDGGRAREGALMDSAGGSR